MVLVFLLLAAATTAVFVIGARQAFTVGWREATRPLLVDYVDRLAAEVAGPPGGPPSVDRARALAERLPLIVRISGPGVNWSSHPGRPGAGARSAAGGPGTDDAAHDTRQADDWHPPEGWEALVSRTTADGHLIRFAIDPAAFERRPRLLGVALLALLLLTLLAWLAVRRLLAPLEAIGAGARRFGAGDFGQPIPVPGPRAADELGELAGTINTMGRDIHRMLESQRALLLAISHELRSPITRARLNAELLPETPEVAEQRDALLRDLHEMADLVGDLLDSERLQRGHAVLQREPTALATLAREVIADLQSRHPAAATVAVDAPARLPDMAVDRARVRLLLRNLLDNALRHGGLGVPPPELRIVAQADGVAIDVRDHGPGVPEDQLAQLAQAFYRPDDARSRAAGGVGLGLYLCRLVAQAHGGTLEVRNARPGLGVRVLLRGG